jgi:hypothetical protein
VERDRFLSAERRPDGGVDHDELHVLATQVIEEIERQGVGLGREADLIPAAGRPCGLRAWA